MGKNYNYKFEVSQSNAQPRDFCAWKWGDWRQSTSWTSETAKDADFSTENARKGLEKAGNLLMLAVKSSTMSPFGKGIEFDKVRIYTRKTDAEDNSVPLRTAVYYHAKVVSVTPKDAKTMPDCGTKEKYNEVLLKVGDGVEVFE